MSPTAMVEREVVWTTVCRLDDIVPETGVCALMDGRQVALFRSGGRIYALDNHDPFSGANVLARGIVGDRNGVLNVASPIYKQNFSLETGQCLDEAAVSVTAYPARVRDGMVEVLPEPLEVAD